MRPRASTTFQTKPFTGPGADAFAALPFVPPASPKDAADIGTPIVENVPPAAQPVSEEEAKAVAAIVTQLFQIGLSELLRKRATLADNIARVVPLQNAVAVSSNMMFQSSMRLSMKYGVRAADELVVGAGLSLAALGFVCKPEARRLPANANADVSQVPTEDKDAPPVEESAPVAMDGMTANELKGIGVNA